MRALHRSSVNRLIRLESYKQSKMFSLEENCGDNQFDNNNEVSQNDVNYPTAVTKPSIDVDAPETAARVSKRKQQFSLRKCQSDTSIGRCSEIDKMGSDISRSRSFDNIETDSIVYESLVRNKAVKKDESIVDSDEDYKLLESSSDDGMNSSDENCQANTIEHTPTLDLGCNGHETNENRIMESNINYNQQQPRAGNEIENDLLCKKYSTLPRVKIKNGNVNVDHDPFVRCSVPNKSFDSRAHCSKENLNEIKVFNDNFKTEITTDTDTSEVLNKIDNKVSDVEAFRSTTLPKTRSRLSEPFSRHSLRRPIDSTVPRKYFRISNALEHSAVIIPDNIESASGTGKNK